MSWFGRRSLEADLLEMLRQEREKSAELTKVILSLQQSGYQVPPAPSVPGSAPPEPEDDELDPDILGAIAMRADRGTREWAHLERQARLLLEQKDADPSEVAQALLIGDAPEDHID